MNDDGIISLILAVAGLVAVGSIIAKFVDAYEEWRGRR